MGKTSNLPQKPLLHQTTVSGSAYLIKLGHFIHSGYLNEIGTNEEAISKIIFDAAKTNDLPGVKEIVEIEFVDLIHLVVRYKYKDWSDDIENGKLFLDKFVLVS
jgi:hypothetical protein